jgi:hypothetical protein
VLQTYDVTRGPQTVALRVLGEERLAPGGPRAWKVEIDYGAFQVTQWVDQKAARAVRTRVVRPGMELIAERAPWRRSGGGRSVGACSPPSTWTPSSRG